MWEAVSKGFTGVRVDNVTSKQRTYQKSSECDLSSFKVIPGKETQDIDCIFLQIPKGGIKIKAAENSMD